MSEASPKTSSIKESFFSNKILLIVMLIVLVLALVSALYFYGQYQKSQNLLKDSANKNSQQEVLDLVKKVGQLIELPTGEEPTIATVSDKTKLGEQPFFEKAENGDKVLIYSKAKKAILYRPSVNKLIEVAPVNLGENSQPSISQTSPTTTPNPTPTPTPKTTKVAIYNGTSTSGLASSTQKKIEAASSNFSVVTKADAVGTYTKTIVVDLVGNQKQLVSDLIKIVGGEAATLPSGEKKPSADILIILGDDSSNQ